MRLVGGQSDPPRPSRETRNKRPATDYRGMPAYRPAEPEAPDRASIAGWLTLVVLVSILGVLGYFIFFDDPEPSGQLGLELPRQGDLGPGSGSAALSVGPAPAPALPEDALRPKSAPVPPASGSPPAPAGGAVEPELPSVSRPVQWLGDPGLSPPPAPRRPSASAAERAELLSLGDGAMESGDIAAARAYYEAAYDAGSAEAATALGRTYDPLFLRETATLGLLADPSKAMEWYRRGAGEGDPVARLRLDALRSLLGQAEEPAARRPRGDP